MDSARDLGGNPALNKEVNLLARYPKAKRNVKARLDNKEENRRIALQFGKEYFDGTREQGYGGYRYDGRWLPIAEDIVRHFGLSAGNRVLDVGCGKGFLVKDLMKVCPGLEAFGIDISEYAVMNCEPEVVGRLQVGDAMHLPFPDNSFEAVISINTIHNLERAGCIQALREMQRLRKMIHFQPNNYETFRGRIVGISEEAWFGGENFSSVMVLNFVEIGASSNDYQDVA